MKIIDISNLNNEIRHLGKSIEDYESTILNIHNIIKDVSFYWDDKRARDLMKSNETDKLLDKRKIEELTEVKEIYQFITLKYSELGKKIEFDLSNESSVDKAINNYIKQLEDIISMYNRIELNLYKEEEKYIKDSKKRVVDLKNKMEQERTLVNKAYSKLKEINNEINNKLVTLNIKPVREKFLKDFM
jgi:DNA repair exonuclease SbcCD ATPase subunit